MSRHWPHRECHDNETVAGGTPDEQDDSPILGGRSIMRVHDEFGRELDVHPAIVAVGVRGLILVDGPEELWKEHMDYMDLGDYGLMGDEPNEPGIYRCQIVIHWQGEDGVDIEIRNTCKIADVLSRGADHGEG